MTVYDVGANRGQFSLLLSRHDATIVAFEPVPSMFDCLVRNLELNRIQNVSPLNLALSDSSGSEGFLFDDDHSTQGKLEHAEPLYENLGERIEVVTATMDECVNDGLPVPDLIKIDVEGGAGSVLRGARALIERYSPSIMLEMHGPEEQMAVKTELKERGYTLYSIDGEEVEDPTVDWHSTFWCERKTDA